MVGSGATGTAALRRASHSVPIVFVNVTDPIGGGLVETLSRPGGNATGFTQFEFGISAKWLELLKQIAPSLTRVAVIRDPMGSPAAVNWVLFKRWPRRSVWTCGRSTRTNQTTSSAASRFCA